MIIKTESGTVYNINRNIATIEGNDYFAVKMWNHFCFDYEAVGNMTLDELIGNKEFHLPLQVGKPMVINGMAEWRISTPIVSIEED